MTKKVNKYFMIVAVVFIILSIAIPLMDYFLTKGMIYSKVEGMTAQEFENYITIYSTYLSPNDNDVSYNSFFTYFGMEYYKYNESSIAIKAVEKLINGQGKELFSFIPYNYSSYFFIWYIVDKIIMIFLAYCIFVIPISMVDLFYKMIKKEVD